MNLENIYSPKSKERVLPEEFSLHDVKSSDAMKFLSEGPVFGPHTKFNQNHYVNILFMQICSCLVEVSRMN